MKEIQKLLNSPKPAKWLFYGDSITHGASHTMGWRDYTELFSERIRYELRRHNDVVIKTAYDGNTTRHLLESFEWRVKQFQPQVGFIMIGTNDCYMEPDGLRVPINEFKDNLRRLISLITAMNRAIPVLQTTCPLLPGKAPGRQENFSKYMSAIRSVARDSRIPIIDHVAYWHRKANTNRNAHQLWMADALHPNEVGHRVFAEYLFKKFKIHSPNSATCRLLAP